MPAKCPRSQEFRAVTLSKASESEGLKASPPVFRARNTSVLNACWQPNGCGKLSANPMSDQNICKSCHNMLVQNASLRAAVVPNDNAVTMQQSVQDVQDCHFTFEAHL